MLLVKSISIELNVSNESGIAESDVNKFRVCSWATGAENPGG